jgi:hypothetical protein
MQKHYGGGEGREVALKGNIEKWKKMLVCTRIALNSGTTTWFTFFLMDRNL